MALNGLGLNFIFHAQDMASNVMRAVQGNYANLEKATGKSVAGLNQKLAQFGTGLALMGAGGAMVGATYKLAEAAGAFETRMTKARQVIDDAHDPLSANAKSLRELALAMADLGVGPNEAAEAMTGLGQAGLRTSEIIASLPSILKFSAANAGVTVNDSIILAKSLMSGFEIELDKIPLAFDQIKTAADASSADVSFMAGMLGRVLGGAKNFRATLSQTLAVTSLAMNAMPTSPELASTGARNLFDRLIKKKSSDQLKALGIETYNEATGQFREIEDVMTDLYDKFGAMTEVKSGQMLGSIFGPAAGKVVAALIGQMNKGIMDVNGVLQKGGPAFQAYLDKVSQGVGVNAKAHAEYMKTWEGSLKHLDAVWKRFQIELGGDFLAYWLDQIDNAITWTKKLTEEWKKLDPAVKNNILTFTLFAGAALLLAGGIAVIGAVIPMMATGIELVVSAIGGVFTGLFALWPLFLLIGGGIAIFEAIQDNIGGMGEAWDLLVDKFSGTKEWLSDVVDWFDEAWEWIKSGFLMVWDVMGPTFEEFAKIIRSIVAQIDAIGVALGDAEGPSAGFAVIFEILGVALGEFVHLAVFAIMQVAKLVAWGLKLAALTIEFFHGGKSIVPMTAEDKEVNWLDARAEGDLLSQMPTKKEMEYDRARRTKDRAEVATAYSGNRAWKRHLRDANRVAAGDLAPDAPSTIPSAAQAAIAALKPSSSFEGVQPNKSVIDYEKLAKAIQSQQLNIWMDGSKVAELVNARNRDDGMRGGTPAGASGGKNP